MRARALLFLMGCAAAAASEAPARSSDEPMPSPASARARGPTAALEATCEGCHADVAEEWRASLHRGSFEDQAFARAFAIEPYPFCQGCHAPEAAAARPPSAEARATGVGCVTCHVTREGGGVVGAPSPGGAPSPHPVLREARFATDAACAGCHEFDFPDARPQGHGPRMQATVTEHAASSARDRACASCHMPMVVAGARPHRSHAFLASRDDGMVRAAVSITATRPSPATLRLVLAPGEVGHAFPTGDLFRRLEVTARVLGDGGAERTVYLARHFAPQRRGESIVSGVPAGDDRVGATPRVVDVPLGGAAPGRPVAWRVVYQRVGHLRGPDERAAAVDGEIEIARGELDP